MYKYVFLSCEIFLSVEYIVYYVCIDGFRWVCGKYQRWVFAISVRTSAIDLVVRNIAELRRCGLKLRIPTFDIYHKPT